VALLLALLAAAARPAAPSPAAAPAPTALAIGPNQKWPLEAPLLTLAVPPDADPSANQTLQLDVSGGWVVWACCGSYGEVVVLQRPPGGGAAKAVASFRTPLDGPPGPSGHMFTVSRPLAVRVAPGATLSVVARSTLGFYPSITANATLLYRRPAARGAGAPAAAVVVARGPSGSGASGARPMRP
jgi:hypothetical protein